MTSQRRRARQITAALCFFPVPVSFGSRPSRPGGGQLAIHADLKRAFLSCLFPERAGNSQRIEVPERRFTGAIPAYAARCPAEVKVPSARHPGVSPRSTFLRTG